MTDLCVFLPTRNRPAKARECITSFRETVKGDADLILILDDDDGSYADGFEDVDKITVTRGTLVTAINSAAAVLAGTYDALMLASDDLVFVTPGWDEILLAKLAAMGGTGIIGWDSRRRYDLLEHVLMSSGIVKALGYFALPCCGHFYVDNAWTELGKRAGLLGYCPDVLIEHRHYSVTPGVEHDATYREAEKKHGAADLAAFQQWRAEQIANEVSVLRRKFSPDVRWVLSRVLSRLPVLLPVAGPVLVAAGEQADSAADAVPVDAAPAGVMAGDAPAVLRRERGADDAVLLVQRIPVTVGQDVVLVQDGQFRLAPGNGVLRVVQGHVLPVCHLPVPGPRHGHAYEVDYAVVDGVKLVVGRVVSLELPRAGRSRLRCRLARLDLRPQPRNRPFFLAAHSPSCSHTERGSTWL